MNAKLLFIALLLLGLSAKSNPEQRGTIRGTVIDKVTKSTLPGANIIILNTDPVIGSSTDVDGKFKFNNIRIGRWSLKISYIGYQDVILPNQDLTSAKELILTIEMEEKVLTKSMVEIKAQTNKSQAINQMTSVSARTFTIEETRQFAGSRNDVARMATGFAGVAVSNDSRNDIIIRGNSPIGLLWRLEGVDIPNPNHWGSNTATGGPVCMLNNNLLANSDFITSAFPAEYGNAVSGVFDLKMRSGNNEKHEFLGQVGFNGFEAGAEGPLSRKNGSSYLINARYSTLEVMEKLGAEMGTGTGVPKYKDFSMKFDFPKTKAGSFSIFALGGNSDIEIWDSRKDTTKESVDFYAGEGYDLTSGSEMVTGGVNHLYSINKNTYIKSTLSGAYHNFTTNVDSLVAQSLEKVQLFENDMNESFVSIATHLNHKFSAKSNLKTGLYFKEVFFNLSEYVYFNEDQALRPTTKFDGSAAVFQPYAQWQYKFSDDVVLNSGLHFTYFGLNNTWSAEPRIGLRYTTNPGHTFSLAYGYHSQLNPFTIYFRQTKMPDGTYKRLNEDLDMLKAHHIVLGYDWSISEYIRLKTEAYYQYLDNAVVDGNQQTYFSMLNQGANFGFWTPDTLINKGTGKNYGLELTFEHFLNKGLYYLVTASLFDSKYTGSDEVERNTAFNGGYVCNALIGKEFILNKNNNKEKKATISIGADLKTTFAGGQRYTPSSIVYNPANDQYALDYDQSKAYSLKYDDYVRTDIKIWYKRNGKKITQEFAIDIQNVFDQKNIYAEKFNKKTGEKSYTYQMGILIIPQYRIMF